MKFSKEVADVIIIGGSFLLGIVIAIGLAIIVIKLFHI